MVTQLMKSLYLLLVGSARPWSSTFVEATDAKASKTAMNAPVSHESAVTRSPACRMVRTSRPARCQTRFGARRRRILVRARRP